MLRLAIHKASKAVHKQQGKDQLYRLATMDSKWFQHTWTRIYKVQNAFLCKVLTSYKQNKQWVIVHKSVSTVETYSCKSHEGKIQCYAINSHVADHRCYVKFLSNQPKHHALFKALLTFFQFLKNLIFKMENNMQIKIKIYLDNSKLQDLHKR